MGQAVCPTQAATVERSPYDKLGFHAALPEFDHPSLPHHRYLENALMLRVVVDRNVCHASIFPRLGFNLATRVVVLLE